MKINTYMYMQIQNLWNYLSTDLPVKMKVKTFYLTSTMAKLIKRAMNSLTTLLIFHLDLTMMGRQNLSHLEYNYGQCNLFLISFHQEFGKYTFKQLYSWLLITVHWFYYRMAREQQFLAGLWCASRKPPRFAFLDPIVQRLNALYTEGTVIGTK